MNSLLLIGIIVLVVVEMILFLLFFKSKQENKRKEIRIEEMGKKINSLRESINVNRRQAFRVDVPHEDCTITFLEFGERALESLLNRIGTGHIQDISVHGLKFTCEFDLPLKKQVVLEIQFKLCEEAFTFKGKLVRKEAHVQTPHITYGMEFIEVEASQQEQLNFILNKIQLERRRKAV